MRCVYVGAWGWVDVRHSELTRGLKGRQSERDRNRYRYRKDRWRGRNERQSGKKRGELKDRMEEERERETETKTTREWKRSIERSGQCRGRVGEAEEMKGCLLICSLTGELKLISETSVCRCRVCRWLSCQEVCMQPYRYTPVWTLCGVRVIAGIMEGGREGGVTRLID